MTVGITMLRIHGTLDAGALDCIALGSDCFAPMTNARVSTEKARPNQVLKSVQPHCHCYTFFQHYSHSNRLRSADLYRNCRLQANAVFGISPCKSQSRGSRTQLSGTPRWPRSILGILLGRDRMREWRCVCASFATSILCGNSDRRDSRRMYTVL